MEMFPLDMLSAQRGSTPDSDAVIEAHLPREPRLKPAGVDQMLNRLKTELIELAHELGSIRKTKKLEKEFPGIDELTRLVRESADLLRTYEGLRPVILDTVAHLIDGLHIYLQEGSPRSLAKSSECLKRITLYFGELQKIMDREKPAYIEFALTLSGNSGDIGQLSDSLRAEAIKLIQEAQETAADEYGWTEVKGSDGKVQRYKAPLGSNMDAVRPPVDPESPEGMRERLTRLQSRGGPEIALNLL